MSPSTLPVVNVTPYELRQILMAKGGMASFVTIVADTIPSMRKTDNPFYDTANKAFVVRKVSTVHGMINWIYGNAVNNQRVREDKEATFTPDPRKWGMRVSKTPFVEHKGQLYLEMKVVKSLGSVLLDGNNNEVDWSSVSPFMATNPNEGARQDIDKKVILRDYKMENIVEVHINQTCYRVIQ